MLEGEGVREDLLRHIEQSGSILLSRVLNPTTLEHNEVGRLIRIVTHAMTFYQIFLLNKAKLERIEGAMVDLSRDALHQLAESLL